MAVQIKLGNYQTLSDGCLGRSYIGCFPRMTEMRRGRLDAACGR
jgi:hypothetical protein